jgi:hypothetical protein
VVPRISTRPRSLPKLLELDSAQVQQSKAQVEEQSESVTFLVVVQHSVFNDAESPANVNERKRKKTTIQAKERLLLPVSHYLALLHHPAFEPVKARRLFCRRFHFSKRIGRICGKSEKHEPQGRGS